ncbi:MAG TPA: TIM barrel protein [Oculatellaceae cyanobacterium]
MRLCFDATRFGCGLDGAVDIAAQRGLSAFEYSFAAFSVSAKSGSTLDSKEQKHMQAIAAKCAEQNVEISLLNLDFNLDPADKKASKQFDAMLKKLFLVAEAIGCKRIAVSAKPGPDDRWKADLAALLNQALAARSTSAVGLVLRLAAPVDCRNHSLKSWRAMEPQDWRDLITLVPELGLSFSPADCVWLGIDYLSIMSGIVKAVEHIEAHDVEINREMLKDSGMYGPLWWRYRAIGKGQVDWRQFIELLKLYDFQGAVSLQFDDEFLSDDTEVLCEALDAGVKFMAPLVRG